MFLCAILCQAYLLTVGEHFIGVFEAVLAALRVWLPLARLRVHVKQLTAAEHRNLWFCHLGAGPVYLAHRQGLEERGWVGEKTEMRTSRYKPSDI